uniref:Uncharacterized protein n=1 Tax=Panagrellus redivivus TaxID=6233 RepID=A0A7E4VPN9_PANRE
MLGSSIVCRVNQPDKRTSRNIRCCSDQSRSRQPAGCRCASARSRSSRLIACTFHTNNRETPSATSIAATLEARVASDFALALLSPSIPPEGLLYQHSPAPYQCSIDRLFLTFHSNH